MIRLFFLIAVMSISNVESKIHQKVVICGVCKDVAPKIRPTIQIMERIASYFDDYRIIVYENNSKDSTVQHLRKWALKNPRVSLESEMLTEDEFKHNIINRLDNGRFFRPETIARARNKVLDKAMRPEFDDFQYLIWMDMDFSIPPSLDGMVEVFESSREWDAILAYGIHHNDSVFFDWYAFRDQNFPLGPEILGDDWWSMNFKCHLTPDDDWYPVFSAFGGFGIYKKSSIIGCRYSANVTSDLEDLNKRIIFSDLASTNFQIKKYFRDLLNFKETAKVDISSLPLYNIRDPSVGIIISDDPNPLLWRMNLEVYKYPCVCEHVPFHAAMIKRGHDKIFIHPRIIFRY